MARQPPATQLPFRLPVTSHYGRDDFIRSASNHRALSLVETWPDWPSKVLVISGPPGSGKSHLAHIWAERADAGIVSAGELANMARPGEALVIEDFIPQRDDEARLFHLVNTMRSQGYWLVLTSRLPPGEWSIKLADLRSRVATFLHGALEAPDDALLRGVIEKLFADRQLTVDPGVVEYMILRMERSLAAAEHLVDTLDREALALKRPVTKPLVAKALEDGQLTFDAVCR